MYDKIHYKLKKKKKREKPDSVYSGKAAAVEGQ